MTNQDVHDAISALIRDKFFCGSQDVKVGPLEMNYFSFCIGAEDSSLGSRQGVYVKIPKADLYIDGRTSIFPISEQDRELACNEYDSLSYLDKNWPGKGFRVVFPRPLGFLEEYNAIVTERFYADEIFHFFRNQDFSKRIASALGNDMMEYLRRLGKALALFHQVEMVPCDADFFPMIGKMRSLLSRLGSSGADSGLIDKVEAMLSPLNAEGQRSYSVKTLKGLDIRNVFVDQDGTIFILDPGKMKSDWREMDLARFLVTCRILYWGSPMFFLGMSPLKVYENHFLASYYAGGEIPNTLLHLCMMKELLKHWEMAYRVLSLKTWPNHIKGFVKKWYIDPFYKMQISLEIEQVR